MSEGLFTSALGFLVARASATTQREKVITLKKSLRHGGIGLQ